MNGRESWEFPRSVVAAIVAGAILFSGLVVALTHYATYLEFECAYPSRMEFSDRLPHAAMIYHGLRRFDWLAFSVVIAWGVAVVFKAKRSVFGIVVYLVVSINLVTLWLLLTLLTMYMINQSFVF